MAINLFDIDDKVRLTATFTVGGAVTDPTTIELKVKDPAGTITTYTFALAQVIRSSAGVYYYDVTPDQSGTWYYHWKGTGTAQAAAEHEFQVKVSKF